MPHVWLSTCVVVEWSDTCNFVSADWTDYFIIVGCREDFHAPDLSQLLDVVKVMSFAVTQGKAAVHCHAGLGRTGVLIACFLVFKERMNPFTAIRHVREKRWGRLARGGRCAITKQLLCLCIVGRAPFRPVCRLKLSRLSLSTFSPCGSSSHQG